VKREINPELVEQATAQDEEFRLREGADEQKTNSEDNDVSGGFITRRDSGAFLSRWLKRRANAPNLLHFTNILLISRL
jgi:hypothetical protein